MLEGLVAVLPGKDKPPSINILPSTIIAVGGIAKVFVGEVVEEGKLGMTGIRFSHLMFFSQSSIGRLGRCPILCH